MGEFDVTDAVREKVALLTAIYGPTGSGKTYSGLLLAAGVAGPDGLVGMIDAENKRGSLYADDPGIRAALPKGYKRVDLTPPYSPKRYIAALRALESAGCTVAVIDSTTHEWSGEGGCCDIAAENRKGNMDNWALAKLEHKRFMAYCLSSRMHIVFCLRAHEKVKVVKAGDLVSPDSTERYEKNGVIPLGMLPDTEKNLVYEVLLSLRVDEHSHFAHPVKVPGMLQHIFGRPHLVTASDGDAVRQWNDAGGKSDPNQKLRERARLAAGDGTVAYEAFFKSLTPNERKALAGTEHEENKKTAAKADAESRNQESEDPESPQPNTEADKKFFADVA
jgi:hypothetical protein